MATADLLLHPVRLRIVQALLGDRELTTGQLRLELPDVSAATVYRQVGHLAAAGVVEVADERRVRGTVERRYRLRPAAASVDEETLAMMGPEEHRQAFAQFVAGLLADFDRYLDGDGRPDLPRDQVGYRQNALELTDDETAQLLAELQDVLGRWRGLGPGPGRSRRLLSTVLLRSR